MEATEAAGVEGEAACSVGEVCSLVCCCREVAVGPGDGFCFYPALMCGRYIYICVCAVLQLG